MPGFRKRVHHKGRSAKKFNRGAKRTKRMNVQMRPMRGGWRV